MLQFASWGLRYLTRRDLGHQITSVATLVGRHTLMGFKTCAWLLGFFAGGLVSCKCKMDESGEDR